MEHTTGFFAGVRRKRIFYQAWLPANGPLGVIFLVHGLGEHSGRYMNIVNRVVPRGWAVYAADLIGHGHSEGMREYVKSFSDFTKNQHLFLDIVKTLITGVPFFLLGQSMGGLISAAFLFERQEDFSGAVLSAPAVKPPSSVSPFLLSMGKIFSSLLPVIRVTGLDIEGISRNPEVIEAYKKDPLVFSGKMTARLGAEMIDTMEYVLRNASKITIPLLILQGGEDRVINKEGASLLFEAAGCEDKTLRMYDGYYHDLFNDLDFERVLDDISAWLEARFSRGE